MIPKTCYCGRYATDFPGRWQCADCEADQATELNQALDLIQAWLEGREDRKPYAESFLLQFGRIPEEAAHDTP